MYHSYFYRDAISVVVLLSDGDVCYQLDLCSFRQSFGAELNPPQLEAAILLMDKNHDGAISLQEFQAWWDKTEIVNVV